MDDLVIRIKQLNVICGLLTEESLINFKENNQFKISVIERLLGELEKDINLCKVSEEKVIQHNSEEENSETITNMLFPIYFALWCNTIP